MRAFKSNVLREMIKVFPANTFLYVNVFWIGLEVFSHCEPSSSSKSPPSSSSKPANLLLSLKSWKHYHDTPVISVRANSLDQDLNYSLFDSLGYFWPKCDQWGSRSDGMDVPADLDRHWSHTRTNVYIWRKGLKGKKQPIQFILYHYTHFPCFPCASVLITVHLAFIHYAYFYETRLIFKPHACINAVKLYFHHHCLQIII
jgi:hypothetical protein